MAGGERNEREWQMRLEAYRVARETRNFEIGLFWQRSNYFLVLNTAVAVGFFARDELDLYAVALSAIGTIVAALWLRINLGSKYWQARWEERLRIVENGLQEGLDLFSAEWDVLDSDAEANLSRSRSRDPGRVVQTFNKYVLRKPSVSKTMSALSLFFVMLWAAAVVVSVVAAAT